MHTEAGSISGIDKWEGKKSQQGNKYLSSMKMFTLDTVVQGKLRHKIPTLRVQMGGTLASICVLSQVSDQSSRNKNEPTTQVVIKLKKQKT